MWVMCDAARHLRRICYTAVKLRPLLYRTTLLTMTVRTETDHPRARFFVAIFGPRLRTRSAWSPAGLSGLTLTIGARRVALARDSGSLVFLRAGIGRQDFWQLDPHNGSERQLTDLPASFVIGDFDVSPDGTEIVFDRVQESSSVVLIERAKESDTHRLRTCDRRAPHRACKLLQSGAKSSQTITPR